MSKSRVALRNCSIDATSEEVHAVVAGAIDDSGGMPQKIRTARSIVVKPNWVGMLVAAAPGQAKRHRGRLINDTDPQVTAAVVRLIREANGSATIYLAEGLDQFRDWDPSRCWELMEAYSLRDEYGVELLHSDEGTVVNAAVPGGGQIQRFIQLRQEIAEADAVVSVAKLKCHQTAGVTLSTKNLFGLVPVSRYGSSIRDYLHQNPFRLMRFFVDLAAVLRPDLAVIDGMVGANYTMEGDGYEAEVVLAGHDHVATDAVATRVMGFDPTANFPDAPFESAENHIRLCAEAGLGVIDPKNIEVMGPAPETFGYQFETHNMHPADVSSKMMQGAQASADTYLRLKEGLLRTHRGKYVFIIGDEVVGSIDSLKDVPDLDFSENKNGYGFAVQVLPDADQPEIIEAYAG